MALLALMVVTIAAALVASALVATRGSATMVLVAERRGVMQAMLDDAERFACQWLDRRAESVVLPPEGGALVLLDYAWQDHQGREGRCTIAVHDVLASLPPAALVAGHPLRMALDAPGSAPVLRINPVDVNPGDLLGRIEVPAGWCRLPPGIHEGLGPGMTDLWTTGVHDRPVVAWFNPDQPGTINVNTAPAALLRITVDSALDLERILASRRRRLPWTTSVPSRHQELHLVTRSSRWNILISVSLAGQKAVRWVVADGNRGFMTIIRRHDVTPASTLSSAP